MQIFRTSKRTYSNKRTQSDDDFVVSGSESEYEPLRKKSHKLKNTRKIGGKRKREKWLISSRFISGKSIFLILDM